MRRSGIGLALAVVLLLGGCGRSESGQVAAGDASTTTTTSPPAAAAPEREAWIVDGSGRRGTFTDADEVRQRLQIRERLASKASLADESLPPAELRARLDALSVIYAIEVRDEAGTVVGYYTTEFVPAADYPARLAEAEALIAAAERGS